MKAILLAAAALSVSTPAWAAGSAPRPTGRLDSMAAWENLPKDGEAGIPYDHNGSEVEVYPRAGMILYARPKAAVASAVKPGALLFKGRFSGGKATGVAFTFKKGCNPAPYVVQGTYRMEGFGGRNEVELAGAAPVPDPKSCAILGYSAKSPNARLRFAFVGGDV